MLNIGLWGYGPSRLKDFVEVNRDLEHKLRELGGMKWLYAQTYYTEDEFWAMYDRDWYNALREKYCATSLPSIYEKVKFHVKAERRPGISSLVDSILSAWPLGGLYGLKKAIDSGSYLNARASTWKSARHTACPSPEG